MEKLFSILLFLFLPVLCFGQVAQGNNAVIPSAVTPGSGGGGSGTVTSVSVVTANGISGSVATATTTPAITLTLGAITPTSVNGDTITTGTGTLTLGSYTASFGGNFTSGGAVTWSGAYGFTGTLTGATSVTFPTSGTLSTTTGTVTAVSVASANGFSGTSSGGATPALTIVAGAITPTSVNGLTFTAETTGFQIAGGTTSKTLVMSNSLTLAGTDSTVMTFPGASDTVSGLAANQTMTGIKTFTPAARTSGSASYLTINVPADTGITTTAESKGINVVGATRTWADGTVALQEEYFFGAPTYDKTTTSAAFTVAATMSIGGPPIAGSGVTFGPTPAVGSVNLLLSNPALGTSTAPALAMVNTTASTSGATVQVSPALIFGAHAWNTTSVAVDNPELWRVWANVASGASTTTTLTFDASANNASSFTNALTLSNAGILTVPSNGGVWSSGSLLLRSGATALVALELGGTFQPFSSNGSVSAGGTSISAATQTSGSTPWLTLTPPTSTGITTTVATPGLTYATATRTWATGAISAQAEITFNGPTYAFAGASTITDAATLQITPPIAGSNATFTRGHSLEVVDSTSAASSITGGLVVAAALGTTATSVGIGGGNINAGGTITSGGLITSGSGITTAAGATNAAGTWKFGGLRSGTGLVASTTSVIQLDVGGTLYSLLTCSTNP